MRIHNPGWFTVWANTYASTVFRGNHVSPRWYNCNIVKILNRDTAIFRKSTTSGGQGLSLRFFFRAVSHCFGGYGTRQQMFGEIYQIFFFIIDMSLPAVARLGHNIFELLQDCRSWRTKLYARYLSQLVWIELQEGLVPPVVSSIRESSSKEKHENKLT